MKITKQYTSALGLVAGIILLSLLTVNFSSLSLISNEKYYSDSYSDMDENGNSSIELDKKKDILSFKYVIRNGVDFPFAGIYFEDTLEGSKIDLSAYDQIEIRIKATKGKVIPITLNTMENLKLRPFQKSLQISDSLATYTIPIREFRTPGWWINENQSYSESENNFEKVSTINIENCSRISNEIEDKVTIEEITFSKNNSRSILIIFTLLIIGSLIIALVPFFKPKKEYIPIKESSYLSKSKEDDKELIISFIAKEYTQSGLTIKDISKSTGIADNQISKILKKHFTMSFKEYLNYVRISEAKRLLQETDLNISEIAYLVGYNNVTHFNRVFKATMELSPNEYRG